MCISLRHRSGLGLAVALTAAATVATVAVTTARAPAALTGLRCTAQ